MEWGWCIKIWAIITTTVALRSSNGNCAQISGQIIFGFTCSLKSLHLYKKWLLQNYLDTSTNIAETKRNKVFLKDGEHNYMSKSWYFVHCAQWFSITTGLSEEQMVTGISCDASTEWCTREPKYVNQWEPQRKIYQVLPNQIKKFSGRSWKSQFLAIGNADNKFVHVGCSCKCSLLFIVIALKVQSLLATPYSTLLSIIKKDWVALTSLRKAPDTNVFSKYSWQKSKK